MNATTKNAYEEDSSEEGKVKKEKILIFFKLQNESVNMAKCESISITWILFLERKPAKDSLLAEV